MTKIASVTWASEAPEIKLSILHKHKFCDYLKKLATNAGLRDPAALAEQMTMVIDGAIIKAQMEGSPHPSAIAKEIFQKLIQRTP